MGCSALRQESTNWQLKAIPWCPVVKVNLTMRVTVGVVESVHCFVTTHTQTHTSPLYFLPICADPNNLLARFLVANHIRAWLNVRSTGNATSISNQQDHRPCHSGSTRAACQLWRWRLPKLSDQWRRRWGWRRPPDVTICISRVCQFGRWHTRQKRRSQDNELGKRKKRQVIYGFLKREWTVPSISLKLREIQWLRWFTQTQKVGYEDVFLSQQHKAVLSVPQAVLRVFVGLTT